MLLKIKCAYIIFLLPFIIIIYGYCKVIDERLNCKSCIEKLIKVQNIANNYLAMRKQGKVDDAFSFIVNELSKLSIPVGFSPTKPYNFVLHKAANNPHLIIFKPSNQTNNEVALKVMQDPESAFISLKGFGNTISIPETKEIYYEDKKIIFTCAYDYDNGQKGGIEEMVDFISNFIPNKSSLSE